MLVRLEDLFQRYAMFLIGFGRLRLAGEENLVSEVDRVVDRDVMRNQGGAGAV